ncbi:zinc finger BED domain-containing protein 5-like [Amblyomma americanum]
MNLIAGKKLLERHMKSAKHEENTRKLMSQPTLMQAMPSIAISSQVKEAEVRLALFVAEHNVPFTVMDHLPKLVKKICPDSDIAKQIACSRTKTSVITKVVTGEESKSRLCRLLREKKFSVMVDESTDVSCAKHLCVVTRVFEKDSVTDAFFDLIPVTDVSANGLYSALTSTFQRAGIPYKENLVGFAADGASVMMGSKHSVMVLLKKEIPGLFILKCTCHSFHLCASYACSKLPRVVEDLVRDVYSYFNSSPKREGTLKKFQALLELKPHKLLHPSQTRWLSLLAAVDRFLEQYDALEAYFASAVSTDRLLATETIYRRLQDPLNKLFLMFLSFVLPLFNNLNKQMQSDAPQLHKLLRSAEACVRTIMDCYLKRSCTQGVEVAKVEFKNPKCFVSLEDMYSAVKQLHSCHPENVQLPLSNVNSSA